MCKRASIERHALNTTTSRTGSSLMRRNVQNVTYLTLVRHCLIILRVMKKLMMRNEIDSLLEELATRLEMAGITPVELIACGGAVVSMTIDFMRTTADIDILAEVVRDKSGSARLRIPVTPELDRVASEMADVFGLNPLWINSEASLQTALGLPEGLLERAKAVNYGDALTVFLPAREDLLALKLMAALDRGDHDTADIRILMEDGEATKRAVGWCVAKGVSTFRLCDILRRAGIEDPEGLLRELD